MLLGIMLALLFGGGTLLFVFSSGELSATQSEPFAAFKFESLPALGKFTCTIQKDYGNNSAIGTMHVLDRQVRVDLPPLHTHAIAKGGAAYAWREGSKEGEVRTISWLTETLTSAEAPLTAGSCKRVLSLKKTLFELPKAIRFR